MSFWTSSKNRQKLGLIKYRYRVGISLASSCLVTSHLNMHGFVSLPKHFLHIDKVVFETFLSDKVVFEKSNICHLLLNNG